MDPKPITREEAARIARHHLGDRLHWVQRAGPHADEWLVQAVPNSGHMIHATAATPDAAAQAAADQLRAQGWTPTHARLEWHRNQLTLVFGSAPFPVATVVALHDDAAVLIHPDAKPWEHRLNVAEALEYIAKWCAANLQSLWLPPFPGDSQ